MTELLRKLRDPGWTPGRKDVGPLLVLLRDAEEDLGETIVRVLEGVAAVSAIERELGEAPKLRHRFVALLGRVAKRDPAAVALLVTELSTDDARSRKASARALGKLQNATVEDALLGALEGEKRVEVRRALVEALGRVGGTKSRAVLAESANAAEDDDALTKTMRSRARVMLERTAVRGKDGADAIVVPERANVIFRCREGLEDLLRLELGDRATSPAPGLVAMPLVRGADEIAASRLWTSVSVPIWDGTYEGDVADAIAEKLAAARDVLLPWTRGMFRFRLSFRDAGHRRAVVFRVAELLQGVPGFVNDPKESPWEVEVIDAAPKLTLVAVAKKIADDRFAYRIADVPAASHPTIAAALALVAGAEDGDVVWDPFVGSGLELIERARFGSYRALLGTDIEPKALAAAEKNVAEARVTKLTLRKEDARRFIPPPQLTPTLVITNPPMGRRVQSAKTLDDLLGGFLAHAIPMIAPGGRFVWLTPKPRLTDPLIKAFRMRVVLRSLVDMGGFTAELQRWEKARLVGARAP
ncbi:hypothetical protein BH09MYX1_BH09MYX1_32210 [soil metagenome]